MDQTTQTLTPVDCACLIHGDYYSWEYVERLYNMLNRNLSAGARLHVYTEIDRAVPGHMIKHSLESWGISGPKVSWWYKMQLFNAQHHSGPLLYFDLDTVIVDNIDWITKLPLTYFWAVRDFKYLWRPNHYSVNSSIMWWNTAKFDHVWNEFQSQNLKTLIKKYKGDQDYINEIMPSQYIKFLDHESIKSWRWECLGKKPNFNKKVATDQSLQTTVLPQKTSVMIFHGQPKPDKIQDPTIIKHWQ